MRTINLQDDLNWHYARHEQPPMDVPVIAVAPMGNLSAHCGRGLLDWTGWLTIDEFNEQLKALFEPDQPTQEQR